MRERRVGDEVFEVVVHPFGLPVRALYPEAEALGDAAAAVVVDRAEDFDAVQAQLAEGVLDQRAARACHDAVPLVVRAEPVADVGLAVRPVDVVVANAARDAPHVEDECGEALVVCVLPYLAAYELARILDRVALAGPRHPRAQVREVVPDERRQLLGVPLVHGSQLQLVVYALADHLVTLRRRGARPRSDAARPPWQSARPRPRSQALSTASARPSRQPGARRARSCPARPRRARPLSGRRAR